jgi:hypothetical protein
VIAEFANDRIGQLASADKNDEPIQFPAHESNQHEKLLTLPSSDRMRIRRVPLLFR